MTLYDLTQQAKANGTTSENKMWESVALFSKAMEQMEKSDPNQYWWIMRKQHGLLFDHHYTEAFANYDVSQLRYTDKEGRNMEGMHWTKNQILDATDDEEFPEDVNDWDKFVAYNVMYADLCRVMDESAILNVCFAFFFDDEDWQDNNHCTKIWDYMQIKPHQTSPKERLIL